MARIDFDKMMDMSLDEIVADGFGKATKPKAARSSPYEGGTCRVFVGNLPYSATWQAVKDHMRKAGNVVHCDILAQPGTACGSKGCAVVQFSTPVEASKAVELTDTNIGGRPIFVREDREEDKGKGKGKVGKGGKPGDWHCPSCGDLQFARNQECRKCNTPRPDEGDLEEFAPGKGGKGGKPGDWHCPSCGDLQFARNQECRKCKTPRPDEGDPEEFAPDDSQRFAPGTTSSSSSTGLGTLQTVLEKNFKKFYCLGAGGIEENDMYAHYHPNGLYVVGLAASHRLRQPGCARIAEFRFRAGVAENEVHGKRSKGATALSARTQLADVRLADGVEVVLAAGVQGALVELNNRLTSEPSLLQSDEAEDEGFLAIIQPRKPKDFDSNASNLSLAEGDCSSFKRPRLALLPESPAAATSRK